MTSDVIYKLPQTQLSATRLRNRLHERNMRARKPAIRPVLAERHRNARTVWCNQHLRWTRQQWAQVLFSDESRFCLQPADGRIRVWRRRGEHFADGSVLKRNRYGGGSIMVWGGISAHHKTPLYHVVGNLTGVRYRNEVLQPFVVPALQQIGPNAVFHDDNARPVRSAAVNSFIQQEDINRMSWPACSPVESDRTSLGRNWTSASFDKITLLLKIVLTCCNSSRNIGTQYPSHRMSPDPLYAPTLCGMPSKQWRSRSLLTLFLLVNLAFDGL